MPLVRDWATGPQFTPSSGGGTLTSDGRQDRISARLPLARKHDRQCMLCEHRCGVERVSGKSGQCHATSVARVFRHRIETGEEPELVPSHLFYLSGCDLRCSFCIAEANAFDASRGTELTPEFFRDAMEWGRERGAKNVQWVGGEPTIHLPRILEAMDGCSELPPIVWKSDFYSTLETYELLDGIIQTYVADFKFGNDHCARQIAGVDEYLRVVTRNLSLASEQGRLIVRHLLLPGHSECCLVPIIAWLQRTLPRATFSLRDGYLPRWRARSDSQLGRRISVCESKEARRLAQDAGLNVIV